MSTRAAQRYQEMDIQAMSPPELIVFLYSVLLAQLHRAKQALAQADIEMRNRTLLKALDVVDELTVALDHRGAGGKLAEDLAALYGFISQELLAIDRTSDIPRLEQLISLVAPLYRAWAQAADVVSRPSSPTVPSHA